MSLASKIEITEKNFYVFLKISEYLTGFKENDLLATGMHETYYYTLMKEPDQDTVNAFFDETDMILKESGNDETELLKQIGSRLIPDFHYFGLARRIILLWYTGIWTSFSETKTSQMVSTEAYKQGLIWKAAETHPAGAKQPGFGSWAEVPLV
jgi:hypothetical protein